MKFAVIGLGSFGSNVAKTLYKRGNDVLAVDKDKNRIEEEKSFVTHAVSMDAAVKDNLKAVGIKDMDVVKADFVIKDSDVLIIMGEEKQLAKLSSSKS